MNPNRTWLAHSDLFTKHWVFEKKSWAKNLGWMSDLEKTAKLNTWAIHGDHELTISDYVNIVDGMDAEKNLYCYNDGTWDYISGPVVFVVPKGEHETFIAAVAGPKEVLDRLKEQDSNPWNWEGIFIIEVDPKIAVAQSIPEWNPPGPGQVNPNLHPVFFTSNGETNADHNWKRLKEVCPRALRVDGISGRRNVFRKCAEVADDSPYFFVVTGKNYVTDPSVFDYLPDESKPIGSHVVFQARNMSNELEYGHMAIGCYNRATVLATPEVFGLDFTEYGTIYTIPLTMSNAHFATTPLEAWRTAFRECVKLTLKNDTISRSWLTRWTSYAAGDNFEWVLLGAKQGSEYATKFRHDGNALLDTVDWDWLKEYFYANAQVVSV